MNKEVSRRTIVAGNWKMHGSRVANQELLQSLTALMTKDNLSTEVLVFPPSLYLDGVSKQLADSDIGFGAQNLSEQAKGAFTGEVSASMLKDLNCGHVLVGHSERRSLYNESSKLVAEKYKAALEGGLIPVLCIGETLAEREAGQTMDIVFRQLDAVLDVVGTEGLSQGIVAYEPVWAIGTGMTASPEQAQEVHHDIRSHLRELDEALAANMQILYGGSVNGQNATQLFAMSDIDGGLIGGASLKADEFFQICKAAG